MNGYTHIRCFLKDTGSEMKWADVLIPQGVDFGTVLSQAKFEGALCTTTVYIAFDQIRLAMPVTISGGATVVNLKPVP